MKYRGLIRKFISTCLTFFVLGAVNPSLAQKTAPVFSFEVAKKRLVIKKNPVLILDNKSFESLKKSMTPQGPRTGGGGNSCAISIHQNTEKLISLVTDMPELLDQNQRQRLFEKISVAKFHLTESLVLDKEEKDAINYPDTNDILISNRFCDIGMKEVNSKAMATLLHEYLGLAKIDDRKYQISGSFLQNYESFIARGYSFVADDSYETNSGCVQSVLIIHQIGNNLIISRSANPLPDYLALTKADVKAFKEMSNRDWGTVKSVRISNKSSGEEYIFTGESCGRLQCDSLVIKQSDGKQKRYDQPIHGLDKIGCGRSLAAPRD